MHYDVGQSLNKKIRLSLHEADSVDAKTSQIAFAFAHHLYTPVHLSLVSTLNHLERGKRISELHISHRTL